MILMKTIARWSSPDILDIPFKVIIYFTLVNSLEKLDFGLLNIAMMIFSYSSISQLGVVDWLLYELPKRYSLKLKMNDLIAQSYTFVFVNQLTLLAIITFVVWYFDEGSWLFRIACAAYMLHTLFYNYYLHKRLYLRFQHKFEHLFNVQSIFVFSKFCLQFGALNFFGIYGFLLVEMVIYLIPICLFRSETNFTLFDPHWLRHYTNLLSNGLPFFIVILMATILGNLDKWYIIGNFGVEKFAMYSVGIFLVTGLMVFPGKVLSITTQYMKEMYVVDKNLTSNIVRNFSINNILIFLLVCLICVLYEFSEYLIILIPKYADVLPLVDAFLLSAILNYSVSLTSNILYLIERRAYVAKVQVAIVIVYATILLLNMHFKLDIVYVVWSMCLVLSLQMFINLISLLVFENIDSKVELIKFLTIVIASVVYYGLNAFGYDDKSIFHYLIFVAIVSLINFNQARENVAYIAYRQFSK